jgi:hypothetical protein
MNTVHFKFTGSITDQLDTDKSQLIIGKFIESCLKCDITIFEPFMEEGDNFQNKEKYEFLDSVKSVFNRIKIFTKSVYEVEKIDSICTGCSKGKDVKHFRVTSNGKYHSEFAYLIDTENGVLKDIYRCHDFKGCEQVEIGADKGLPPIKISASMWNEMGKDPTWIDRR